MPDKPEPDPNLLTRRGVAWLGVYVFLLPFLLVHLMVKLWPPPRDADEAMIQSVRTLKAATRAYREVTEPESGTATTKPATGSEQQPSPQGARPVSQPATDAASEATAGPETTPGETRRDATEAVPGGARSKYETVHLLGFIPIAPSPEVRLILLVLVLGALGSFIHLAASYVDYAGNQQLKRSWLGFYLLRAPTGMALAFVLYVVIRGGFLTPQGDVNDINRFGIAALACLAGMFSRQASDKMQDVFETLFPSKQNEKRKDPLGEKPVPKLFKLDPKSAPAGTKGLVLELVGADFVADSIVKLKGTDVKPQFVDSFRLKVPVPDALLAAAGEWSVAVYNPPPRGGLSEELSFKVT